MSNGNEAIQEKVLSVEHDHKAFLFEGDAAEVILYISDGLFCMVFSVGVMKRMVCDGRFTVCDPGKLQ